MRGQVYRRANGSPLLLLGVSRDITDRKRIDEHRTLLANELNHRIKNMLATPQAIVSQTLRSAGSLQEPDKRLSARIRSMDVANDLLVNEQWEGASIRKLIERALAPPSGRAATSQIGCTSAGERRKGRPRPRQRVPGSAPS